MTKMTRTDYVCNRQKRPCPVYYSGVAEGIRLGEIPFYYEDGKILIDDEETDAHFLKKVEARLSALKSAEKVNLFA
jgi:hypothetical protein